MGCSIDFFSVYLALEHVVGIERVVSQHRTPLLAPVGWRLRSLVHFAAIGIFLASFFLDVPAVELDSDYSASARSCCFHSLLLVGFWPIFSTQLQSFVDCVFGYWVLAYFLPAFLLISTQSMDMR